MLTVLILCFFRFTCGFLLGNGTSSIPVKQTYLTTTEYFTDQDQIKQQLALQSQKIKLQSQEITLQSNELMNKASHGELNLLASQIQNKLDAFEQKLLTQASTGTSQTSGAEIEHKYQALEQKFTTLEQKNKLLEQTLATKEQEMVELRQNQTLQMTNLQQKIVNLEHLKSINQTQTLDNLDQKIQTLVTKVNALENTVQARSQDFVALYNEVKQQTTTMKELENTTKQQTTAMEKLENTTKQQTTAMEKLENTTKQQTAAMEKLGNRTQRDLNLNHRLQNESLNHLQQYINGQLQPIILTACNHSGSAWRVEQYSPLLFPNILTSVGVPDQSKTHFTQTGRFRCSIPGYYYVTTTMESYTDYTYIAIMVNSDRKHYQNVSGKADGSWKLGTSDVTLHLTTGDEVWIQHTSSRRDFVRSCFTIFKIK